MRISAVYDISEQFHSVLRQWVTPTELVESKDMYLYTTRAVPLSTQTLAHVIRHVRVRRIAQALWKFPCDAS